MQLCDAWTSVHGWIEKHDYQRTFMEKMGEEHINDSEGIQKMLTEGFNQMNLDEPVAILDR